MTSRRCVLAAILLFLATSATVVLVTEYSRRRHSDHREAFQRLLGGIGFGPALDLSECVFGFDPRLDCTCSQGHDAIPGGSCFCPLHGGALFSYPPLDPKYLSDEEAGSRGSSP